MLERQFKEGEVCKALSPDSFTIEHEQRCGVIKVDVMRFLQEFHMLGTFRGVLN